jgi:hypothetical protein
MALSVQFVQEARDFRSRKRAFPDDSQAVWLAEVPSIRPSALMLTEGGKLLHEIELVAT